MNASVEEGFLGLAVVVLIGSLLAVGVAPSSATIDRQAGLSVDADVPAEYSFEAPDRDGVATVDDREYQSVQNAVDDAGPGDTVVLRGRFDQQLVVRTPDLTLTSPPGEMALLDGGGAGDTLVLHGDNATVQRLWVRNSGRDAANNDAGIWVNSTGARVLDSRLTEITFGVWVDGVDNVLIRNSTITGRESVTPLSYRGNGIQLWKTERSAVRNTRITDVRDGIYYSWADSVVATNNTMWDLRYGVHYMYSDDCLLRNNLAFDNDIGYALMVSEGLEIVDNVAVNNRGTSGHGVLLKDIDETTISNNSVVGNLQGLYVYNSLDNVIKGNLVLENEVGVQLTAGSVHEQVYGNSFIHNDASVMAVTSQQVAWNRTGEGNYWSEAGTADLDRDGVSEIRHRPTGLVENLVYEHPQAAVFANSPAFDAIRLAQSSFPVIDSPGVVDHHPLASPRHDNWKSYYERD